MRKVVSIFLILLLALSLATTATALPLDKSPAGSVLVTVVGKDSTPLPGAVVQLLTPGTPDVMTARTNHLGQALLTLPEGFSFWLRAWADGYAVVERPYVPLTDGMSITLQATAYTTSLIGFVTDDRGSPIPGAHVTVWQGNLGLQGSARSDALGVYRIEGLRAEGGYTLQVEAAGFQPFAQSDVVLDSAVQNQVDVQLTPSSGSVTGEIVDARTKLPLPLVTIELVLSGWGVVDKTKTDDSGYFTFTAPAGVSGSYQIRLWARGYETLTSSAFTVTPGSWTDFSGANRFELNPLYAELTGVVLNEAGSPMADVEVVLQRSGLGTIRTTQTDENGAYHFEDVPSGTYRTRALPNEHLIHGDSGWITVTGGERATGDIVAGNPDSASYGSASIIGTVQDHLGEPIEGAAVTAYRAGQTYRATTDEQGRYRLSVEANVEDAAVDPETSTGYHVTVSAPDFIPSDQQVVAEGNLPPSLIDVQTGSVNRADFTLYPVHGSFSGRVMDHRGQPLQNIVVSLREEGSGEVKRVETDTLGRYHFANLEVARQARYLPIVADSEYVEGSVLTDGTISSPAGVNPGTTVSTTLTARPRIGHIQGIVKAGGQTFASGANVTVVRPADGVQWSGVVGEQGTYSIPVEVSPNGQYLVRAKQEGTSPGSALTVVSLAENDAVTVNLSTVPQATITGAVYADDGRPAAKVMVSLWAEGKGSYALTATTDAAGRFRFDNLKPGVRYMVSASNGFSTWSALMPGEPIVSPLVIPTPGQVIWIDIQTRR